MVTKHDVIREHKAHPDWCSADIARHLGCISGYVRATAQRNGLKLPIGKGRSGTGVATLGRHARALGFRHTDDLDRAAKRLSR